MAAVARSTWLALFTLCSLVLVASPAKATFLGLDAGDVLDTVGYTIPGAGGVFNDVSDELDVSAQADDITTTTAVVLTEIGGGAIDVNLDLISETLLFLGDGGTGGLTFIYS